VVISLLLFCCPGVQLWRSYLCFSLSRTESVLSSIGTSQLWQNLWVIGGGELAAVALERKAIAAIVNDARVIAPCSYHFVIAVWRAKEAESGA